MKNLILPIILLFYWNSNAQIKQERQIVIIRTSYYAYLLSPKCIMNKKDTIKIKSRSFIVKKIESDSLTVEIPYLNGLFQNKIASYSFSTKDPVNYLVFKYEFLHSKPSLKKIEGEELVKLKQKKYVQKNIKKFNLR